MLIDILATDNSISFNISIAKAFGLQGAVYLSELINITNKASIKHKLIEGKCLIDRQYISNRTTITPAEQRDIDKKLSDIEIITVDSNNTDLISLDLETLAKIVTSNDTQLIGDAAKLARIKTKAQSAKVSQRRQTIEELKDYAYHPNVELNEAYRDWVEGVYSNPTGFLSKKSVDVFKKEIDAYAQGDLDLALKIIEIATINGWRCAEWAIAEFKRNYESDFRRMYEPSPQVIAKPDITVGEEVF